MSDSEREDPNRPTGEAAAGAVDPDADPTEGSYTESDDAPPHLRTVAGAYTSGAGVDDDESEVGSYTSTEEHPEVHDPSERHGRFASNDPGRPHRPKAH